MRSRPRPRLWLWLWLWLWPWMEYENTAGLLPGGVVSLHLAEIVYSIVPIN